MNIRFKKYVLVAILCAILSGTVLLSGCNKEDSQNTESMIQSQNSENSEPLSYSSNTDTTISENAIVNFEEDELNALWDENNSTKITLKNSSVDISGNGASVSENTITISSAGTYIINGNLNNGQIVINAGKKDIVKLVLNNVSISSSSSPAIYSEKSQKTIIILPNGTINSLSDGSNYVSEISSNETEDSSSPNAAIFCQDDLTITGGGSLNISGNAHNGITSKDILRIVNGNINVKAQNNGITGRDNLAIIGGKITVDVMGDGIRSTYIETDNSSKGHIFIENSDITITSLQDGIQSAKDLTITSGTFNITAGGGFDGVHKTSNDFPKGFESTSDSISKKAIKAGSLITINNGKITTNSYEDSIHCNGNIQINGGNFELSAGDDAVHADDTLTITNGNINIVSSYEGLEANNINISGGTIDLVSFDDGINAAGGNDSSGFGGGHPQDNFINNQSTAQFNISDGTIYINSESDGIDSNAEINISGGTIIINGTTSGGNSIIDHDGSCEITGGILVGSGTSDMLEMPEETSTQNTVAIIFNSPQNSGMLCYISDSTGNIISAVTPPKNFDCIILSSPLLKTGETYSVYIGGTASGDSANGYYSKASVNGGTKYSEFTISKPVTYVDQNGITEYHGKSNIGGTGDRMHGEPGIRSGNRFN